MLRPTRFLPFALLVALSGCWGGAGTVSGKVTLNGATPVTAGIVVFTTAKGVAFSGHIDQQGNYQLANLPAEEMKITVFNSPVPPGAGKVADPDAPPAAAPALIPKRYEDSDSGLRYQVKSGSQIHNIDLQP